MYLVLVQGDFILRVDCPLRSVEGTELLVHFDVSDGAISQRQTTPKAAAFLCFFHSERICI
jgi:hypothetical protein